MMTPMAPQQYAEPPVPPGSQDLKQTDLGQEQDEDEDQRKGENSSKTVGNTSNVPFIYGCASLCVPTNARRAGKWRGYALLSKPVSQEGRYTPP